MLRRKCKATGCLRYRVEGSSYCIEHQNLQRKDDEERAMRVKQGFYKNARHNQWQNLYSSPRWKKLREEVLRDSPYCEICGSIATDVHHIVPHNGDPELFYDRTNLVSICSSCHSKETQKESEQRKQRPKFVKNPRNRKLWY